MDSGIILIFHEVKSHETYTSVVPVERQMGNGCADYHAGEAVIEAPSREVARLRGIDSSARRFQERMIQALLLQP